MHWSVDLLLTAVKEAVVFSAIGAGVSLIALLVGFGQFVPALGIVLLLEATGLMMIGGALDLGSSGSGRSTLRQMKMLFGRMIPAEETLGPVEEKKRAQFNAAKYSLTGVLLFLEALFLAVLLY